MTSDSCTFTEAMRSWIGPFLQKGKHSYRSYPLYTYTYAFENQEGHAETQIEIR